MIHSLLSSFSKSKAAERVSLTPPGTRIYAIGDVHGCSDQLCRLLDLIADDTATHRLKSHLVFLGDLVDRGPDTAGVLGRLTTAGLPAEEVSFLMGNHEEAMIDSYDGREGSAGAWLRHGGFETMESYRISRKQMFSKTFDLAQTMRVVIPERHIRFLKSFKDHIVLGDYLFVHAGIRPGIPLQQQDRRDLRWIRSEFLDDSTDHGMTVVHGHTIVPRVQMHDNRVAVDTGCYRGGPLSALVLDGEDRRVLSVR